LIPSGWDAVLNSELSPCAPPRHHVLEPYAPLLPPDRSPPPALPPDFRGTDERLIRTDQPADQRSRHPNPVVHPSNLTNQSPNPEVGTLLPLDSPFHPTAKPSVREVIPANRTDPPPVAPDEPPVSLDPPFIRAVNPAHPGGNALNRTDQPCYPAFFDPIHPGKQTKNNQKPQ
jgi:hypothetical protein